MGKRRANLNLQQVYSNAAKWKTRALNKPTPESTQEAANDQFISRDLPRAEVSTGHEGGPLAPVVKIFFWKNEKFTYLTSSSQFFLEDLTWR